ELHDKFDEQFEVLKGGDIREQYGINQWLERPQIVTSLDLAKRNEILPGLRQVRWDLVIVDEAHRLSWTPPSRKTARYALGELLRDISEHDNLIKRSSFGCRTPAAWPAAIRRASSFVSSLAADRRLGLRVLTSDRCV